MRKYSKFGFISRLCACICARVTVSVLVGVATVSHVRILPRIVIVVLGVMVRVGRGMRSGWRRRLMLMLSMMMMTALLKLLIPTVLPVPLLLLAVRCRGWWCSRLWLLGRWQGRCWATEGVQLVTGMMKGAFHHAKPIETLVALIGIVARWSKFHFRFDRYKFGK